MQSADPLLSLQRMALEALDVKEDSTLGCRELDYTVAEPAAFKGSIWAFSGQGGRATTITNMTVRCWQMQLVIVRQG